MNKPFDCEKAFEYILTEMAKQCLINLRFVDKKLMFKTFEETIDDCMEEKSKVSLAALKVIMVMMPALFVTQKETFENFDLNVASYLRKTHYPYDDDSDYD